MKTFLLFYLIVLLNRVLFFTCALKSIHLHVEKHCFSCTVLELVWLEDFFPMFIRLAGFALSNWAKYIAGRWQEVFISLWLQALWQGLLVRHWRGVSMCWWRLMNPDEPLWVSFVVHLVCTHPRVLVSCSCSVSCLPTCSCLLLSIFLLSSGACPMGILYFQL